MKKILAIITLLLVLALSISMFVACDEEENPTEETSETTTEQPTELPSDEQPTQTPTEDPSELPSEEDPTEPPICKHETLETLPAVEATCTATGLTEGKKCSVCGEITIAQTTVEAKGHNEISIGDAIAPTCTEIGITAGKKCSVCNEVTEARAYIPALGHTEAEIPAVAPTCTTAGSLSGKKCSVCEVVLIKPYAVDARGHNVVDIPAVAPTCSEAGSTEGEMCETCEVIIIAPKKVPMIAHELVAIGEEIKPTCTTVGKTAGEKCANCDYIAVPRTDIEKLPHTVVAVDEEIAPTCTSEGLTAGEKCSVCQTVITEPVTIPKLPHSEEVIPAVVPTCTESGLTEGIKCSVCDEVITEPMSVAATGHLNTEFKEILSTCTEAGKKLTLCADCGEEISSENLPLAAHTIVAAGEAIAPTCSATGLTAGEKCDVCGEILKEQEVLATVAHTEEPISEKAPTCTTSGSGTGTKCSVCGDILQAPELIPATGHINTTETITNATCALEGEKKVICECGDVVSSEIIQKLPHERETFGEEIAPTCTDTGKTTGIKCSVCDAILDAQEDIPALGHSWTELKGMDATCTESGLEIGHQCTVCKEIEQNEIPALGHSASAAWSSDDAEHWQTCIRCGTEIENSKAAHTEGEKCSVCGYGCDHADTTSETKTPTCTATGSTIVTCSDCGAVVKETTIPATGHTDEVIPKVDATCTETGLTEGKKCLECGTVTVAQKPLPAKGHSNNYWVTVTPATCKSEGSDKQVCGVCEQDTGVTKVTDKTAHTENTTIKEPTCSKEGLKTVSCSVCDITLGTVNLPKAPHTEVAIGEAKDPTCTTTGLTAGKKCSVCNEVIEEQKSLATVGHTKVEIPAVAPTCTTDGKTPGIKCSVCDFVIDAQQTVSKTGHNEEAVPAVNATCTTTGLTAGKKCTDCGEIIVAQKEIPALGHTEETLPAVNATCTTTGLTAGKKCTVCGEIIVAQVEIPALGHTLVQVDANAPTCTEIGWNAYEYCSVCDHTTYAEIAATGHTIVKVDAKAPTCTEIGWNAYERCSACDYTTYVEIAATGHTIVQVDAKAPTCTETGYAAYEYCSACDYTTYVEIAATDHSWDNACDTECNNGCGETRETTHVDVEEFDLVCDECGAEVTPATLTIEQAVALGGEQGNSKYTSEWYFITGTITEIVNTVYGNCYITDDNGNTIYIYGLKSQDGTTSYGSLENKPVVGDTIKVASIVGNYNGDVQLKNARIFEITAHEHTYTGDCDTACDICETAREAIGAHVDADGDNLCDACGGLMVIPELTISEAVTLGGEKEHNTYTADKYHVTGTIESITDTYNGRLYITDGEGNKIYIYNLLSADGSLSFNNLTEKPGVGDTIKVLTVVGQYSGTPQLKDAWLVEFTKHTCAYTYDCSTKCPICGAVREAVADHTYDDLCADTECNVCGETRRALVCVDADSNSKCDVCGKDYSAPVGPTYQVATSVEVGDKIILTGAKSDGSTYEFTGLSGTSGNVNGLATLYTTDDPSGTFVLEVVAGSAEGSVAFRTPDGKYIGWKSGAKNKISVIDAVDATSSWTVTFSDGQAVITNVGSTSEVRILQFNANSGQERFCTYKGTQESVTIFKVNT